MTLTMATYATHQACRAQMGSISVTMTMAPIPFKAAQQPFPTWKLTKIINTENGINVTHFSIAAHKNLLSS